MENIEDVIEITRKEERAEKDRKFREELKSRLAETVAKKAKPMVEIPLDEYIELKQKDADFQRLFFAIMDGMRLNYNQEELCYYESTGTITNVFVALFPEIAKDLLEKLKEEAENASN